MNHVYGCEEDRLFSWLRGVRRVVEDAELEKSGWGRLLAKAANMYHGCSTNLVQIGV